MRPQRLNCRALRRSHRGQHCRNLAPTRRKSQRTWTCRRFLIHRVVRRRMFQIPGVMPIAQWLCPYWNGTVERPRSIEWNRGQTHSAVVMPVTRAEGVGLLWDLRCLSFCPLSMVHGDHAGMLFRYMVVAVDLEFSSQKNYAPFFRENSKSPPSSHKAAKGLESNPLIFLFFYCRFNIPSNILGNILFG